ncbi:MAG TPA: ATP-binding protein [Candidatus Binatia bacterium]|nr:ATP-binding protein [Candidatus Binatia bacterium]
MLLDFPDVVQELVKQWLLRPGDGLLITGKAGVGKTHLLIACARTAIQLSRPSRVDFFQKFYMDLRDTYRRNESEEMAYASRDNTPFLFIDDLGVGALSDMERRCTLELLDRRLHKMRPTCLTSNWCLAEIAEKFDERIASRLQSFQQIEITGPDRRGLAAS